MSLQLTRQARLLRAISTSNIELNRLLLEDNYLNC